MLILDEDCVVRRVKAKSQVIKPIYAMLVRTDQIFDNKEEYSKAYISDTWTGLKYEEIYFVTNKGKLTRRISKARQFKSLFGYIWWCYWHSLMDIPAPHKLINIAPYLEALKYKRTKWREFEEWLSFQPWENGCVSKDKLLAKVRKLDETIVVPYNEFEDT